MDEYNNYNNGNNVNNEPQGNTPPPQQPYPPNYYGAQQTPPPPPPPPNGSSSYQWNFENMQHEAAAPKVKRGNRGLRTFGIIVAAIALVVMGGFASYGIFVAATGNSITNILPNIQGDGPASTAEMPQISLNNRPGDTPKVAEDGGMSNNEIFKKVSPSVVGIISYVNVGSEYFGAIGEAQEQGSGIIMSSDGYVITNEHVVANAVTTGGRIEVVDSNGDTYEAVYIGGDSQTDLAVLKVEAAGLPAAEFGNSDQLEVGERVVAIGNPGGLQFANSLTVGYVSAKDRILSTGEVGYALECIQTDAAINPGNSGGALINAYGQVIGINSAKMKTTENFEGMGFAIPINDATPIVQDIITNGKVTGRAMLGITAKPVSASEAQQYSMPMGLMITEFAEGSDLPGKGAKVGDVITHINSIPIYTTTGSAEILKEFAPGDTVTLSLYRRDARGRAGSFNVDVALSSS